MSSERRLFFVNGPWQAIVALASLLTEKQGRLGELTKLANVVVFTNASYTKESMRAMESVFTNVLEGRVEFRHIARERYLVNRIKRMMFADLTRKRLAEQGLLDAVREIWALDCTPRDLLDCYRDSEEYLFEDGVMSYSHMRFSEQVRAPQGKRFAFVPEVAGERWASVLTRITPDAVHTILRSLSDSVRIESVCEASSCVVLGQGFHRSLYMHREDELACYRQICQWIVDHGDTVLWKDHPRDHVPFYPELKQEFRDKLAAFCADSAWPVEVVIERSPIRACYGATCSSLMYFPSLFGIPSFTGGEIFLRNRFRGIRRNWRREVLKREYEVVRGVAQPLFVN